MKNTLISIDSAFTNHYKSLLTVQEDIWNQLKAYSFNLEINEITEAIIARMEAFWYFNVANTKGILKRNTNTTAADFFTETSMLFIKAYFENKYDLSVRSELSIVPGRNVIRPDISIWNREELVAVIELKVNKGWKGKDIIPHLIEREAKIQSIHPNAYFGVIGFWNFFDTEDVNWNSKYISILHFNEKEMHPKTGGRVENLLSEIEKHISILIVSNK